jgi:uncharacterized protein involved in response to NO
MMRPKNKQRCLITVNVLIALWTSVEMIRCWGKGDILIGIANAEIAVWAVSEISGLVRKARKVSDGITNESTMESTGDFIWYLCFILFCVFFAVCFVISPDLRRKSVAITILAIALPVVLLTRLPHHVQNYQQYREYKKYHN